MFLATSLSYPSYVGATAVSSAHDDQDPALRVLRGSVFVAQDPEAIGGRRSLSRVGGRESTRFPNHLGFSEAAPKSVGRDVPAAVTADAGDGNHEAGAGGAGWE